MRRACNTRLVTLKGEEDTLTRRHAAMPSGPFATNVRAAEDTSCKTTPYSNALAAVSPDVELDSELDFDDSSLSLGSESDRSCCEPRTRYSRAMYSNGVDTPVPFNCEHVKTHNRRHELGAFRKRKWK